MSSTQKAPQPAPSGRRPITRNSKKLTTATNRPPGNEEEPKIAQEPPKNLAEPSKLVPDPLPTIAKHPQSSGAPTPPESASAGTDAAEKDKVDWDQVMDEVNRNRQLEEERLVNLEDGSFRLDPNSPEEERSELDDIYNEVDDSFVDKAPMNIGKVLVPPEPAAVAKPSKGKTGGRKTAKVVTIKDIANEMRGE